IDQLDQDLVSLLNRRAEIASQIGQIKHHQGLEIWSAAREDEVIARALAASQGPLPIETLRLIFRELMSGSRSLQRTLRVASLGPKYSYSYLAAVAKFGEAVEHVPVGSIAAVFEELNRRHVQFGIVPLENSTDGRIADTLDMFIKLPNVKIRAEVRLRIHHCLLGRCEWGQVRRVYSKSQALSQCRNWLGKNLPQATKVEVVSLVKTISPFEKFGVNLTWIESFPIPNTQGENDPSYLFFMDIDGHESDPPVQKAIEAVRKRCERLDILGSYPRCKVIEA